MGYFNTQTSMKVFCDSYEFKNLIKDATCYKNPENPSCIDLILTNNPNSFQNSGVIETGLSDFHKMMVTVMKTTYIYIKKLRNIYLKNLSHNNKRESNKQRNYCVLFYEKQKLTIMQT